MQVCTGVGSQVCRGVGARPVAFGRESPDPSNSGRTKQVREGVVVVGMVQQERVKEETMVLLRGKRQKVVSFKRGI